MDLYIVQPGDTVYTISQQFNVPYDRLVYDNNILPDYNLVPGQTILLAYPALTYAVQEGDTMKTIASANGISVVELLRNNPYLADRDYLNIGEELILSYDKSDKQIEIDAFCFPYIRENVLKKCLPYLTYLTIAGYRVTAYAEIQSPDNSEIIKMAKEYGTAPVMLISTFTEQGKGSYGISNRILNDEDLQNKLIENILYLLRENGFFAVNFGFSNIMPEDLQNYVNLITKAKDVLAKEGYQVFVTLVPNTFGFKANVNNDIPYFSQIGQVADAVVLLSYQWANAYIPTYEQTTIPFLTSFVEYVSTQIPPEKIFLSYTRTAYDWELPYVEGESPVYAIANFEALNQASQLGVPTSFDEFYVTPYYNYYRDGIQHFVWFKDARTLNALLNLVVTYDLKGISVWNIMDYSPQMWLTINSQYSIVKVLNVTSEFLS